ncbi:hypothetical protein [Streptomyces olivaceus]|uniref:hypothetical protein n=1 Tax=Streptomyces olivaceus TaxID=47716 RepID=UPI0040560A70
MLLTIAERYAEGRIDDLLDADHLAGVTPAAPRERLRAIVVGLTVVLVMAGAAFLGLPDTALIPLLPVINPPCSYDMRSSLSCSAVDIEMTKWSTVRAAVVLWESCGRRRR